MGPQRRCKLNLMGHFFTKMGYMTDLGFGTSYKDLLCPKVEDKSYKA